MRRRSFLAGSAALLTTSLRAATPPSEMVQITPDLITAAQKEGRVLARYSSPVDEMTGMARAFEKRFAIQVQMDRKVGVVATQLFATEERAGQHVMDVNFGSDPPGLLDLADESFYLRYTLPDIAQKIDPSCIISELGYAPRWTDVIVAYNPSVLPHTRAKQLLSTWSGLLDPTLSGRIGLTEPAGGGVAFVTYLMFYRLPQYGRAFLQQLAKQKPRLYPGSAQGREDLAAGAISVFLPDWESAELAEVLKGSKIAWWYPEILPGFANTFLSISAHAPHPAAARLFCAWFFTPEGGPALEATQSRPTLKGIPDTRSGLEVVNKTDWWQPLPERRWTPSQEDWNKNYAELMPDMRTVLGWTG
jgi:ABC-type Fe3+ transport system substrate-binding protein